MSNGNGEVSPVSINIAESVRLLQQAWALRINASSLSGRAAIAGQLGKAFGGDRDYYTELGYPVDPQFEQYYGMYEREGIASRVIEAPATDSWKDAPEILDGNEELGYETDTGFVKEATALATRLKLWHYFKRADILTGIGRYGILLVGVSGEKQLNEPLEASDVSDASSIIYLKPYHEGTAKVKTIEKDTTDPRFGLVKTYAVTLDDEMGTDQEIHHSRVIHILENPTESEIYGKPRLQRVLNYLMDVTKTVGGSAEILWQIMDRGMQADIDPEYDITPEEEDALEDEFEAYYHKLQRYIRTRGVTVNPLGAGNPSDPTGIFKILIGLVSASTDIPQRKLLGSERGELASTQDDVNWASYITSRQNNFTEPVILRPFFDMMITLGALPVPDSGTYDFKFPSVFQLNPVEQTDVNKTKAEILNLVAPFGADLVVPPAEARQELLGLPAEVPLDLVGVDIEARLLDAETMTDVDGQPATTEG
jgi:hypothetical protein